MRVIIDTNIFISREEGAKLNLDIAELSVFLLNNKITPLVHPISYNELKTFPDASLRRINLSKIKAYPLLESSQDPYVLNDSDYLDIIDKDRDASSNNRNDNIILYSIYKNAASILITNDKKLIKKANRFSPPLEVYSVDDALEYLRRVYPESSNAEYPLGIQKVPMHSVNLNDHLFDSLKADYGDEFIPWFTKKAAEGRMCYITYKPNSSELGSFMSYKEETEAIPCNPPLSAKRRVKIATLKVSYNGFRIGEALINHTLNYAMKNGIDEIYLTHFTEPESDGLVNLIKRYGFYYHGYDDAKYPGRREDIYVKKLSPDNSGEFSSRNPYSDDIKYFPSFYCGESVNKFVIPIQPQFHDRLFLNSGPRQTTLSEHAGEHCVEGYASFKAYLSRSNISSIKPGDILLFYKSVDQYLSTICIVDEFHPSVHENTETIMNIIRRRTVYSYEDVENMGRPLTVILFRHNANIHKIMSLSSLRNEGILNGAPQSITQISNADFQKLIELGVVDAGLTFY